MSGPRLAPQFRVDLIRRTKPTGWRPTRPPDAGEPEPEDVPDELSHQVEMIAELLDAFGHRRGGAEVRSRRRPGHPRSAEHRWGSRDRRQRRPRPPATGGRRGPSGRVCIWNRGLSNAVMFGPGEVAERYGVPDTGRRGIRGTCAAARRSPPTVCPAFRESARRPRPRCCVKYGSLTKSSPPQWIPNPRCLKPSAQSCGVHRLHRGGPAGGTRGPRCAGRAVDRDGPTH